MKRIFTLLISLFLLAQMQAQTPIQPRNYNEVVYLEVDSAFIIENLGNLLWLFERSAVIYNCVQTADIDASETSGWYSGAGFPPIDNFEGYDDFKPVYYGQGHTISNLTINRPSQTGVGLFKDNRGTIKDLILTNVNITGSNRVGGLAGMNYYAIENCSVTGSVKGTAAVGGLVGYGSYSSIIKSNFTGTVVSENSVNCYAGGLVGRADYSSVSKCYSAGSVTGWDFVGGLIGWTENDNQIINSYSTASVNGVDRLGGLIGYASYSTLQITNCFSTGLVTGGYNQPNIGGLIGNYVPTGTVTASFWNTETCNTFFSGGGIGKTTAELNDLTTFLNAGWDLKGETANGSGDPWNINLYSNTGYPFLTYQFPAEPGQTIPLGAGTEPNPYQIASPENLFWLSQNYHLIEDHTCVQTANIDLSVTNAWVNGTGFYPIGRNGNAFQGSYNGQGHTISNLYINRSFPSDEEGSIGLFGSSAAFIQNLGITNVNITGGNCYAGALSGGASGLVSNCYSTGTISAIPGTEFIAGGLVGTLVSVYGYPMINSWSSCNITGGDVIGGLIGVSYLGLVSNCWSSGAISDGITMGGMIGYEYEEGPGTYTNNFWDTETSGQATDAGAGNMGKTTAQMKTLATFTGGGFDFATKWGMNGSLHSGYPFLLMQYPNSFTGAISSDWATADNWYTGTVPGATDDYYINRSAVNFPVVGSGSLAVIDQLYIDNEATLTVGTGGKINVSGQLTNNGTLTIASDASSDGSMIVNGNLSGDGAFIRQQYVPNDANWHEIASPTQNFTILGSDFVPAPVGGVLPSNFSFYGFNQAVANAWVNIRAVGSGVNGSFETSFIRGKGYLVNYPASYGKTNMEYQGVFNTGNVSTPTLAYTPGAPWRGWNLLGNPYTSAIDWNKANRSAFVDNFAYIYSSTKPGGAGYIQRDGSTSGSGSVIAAGQGFFVIVNQAGNFTFTNSMQVHSTDKLLKSTTANEDNLLKLRLSSDIHFDETIIRVNENANSERDRYDALKVLSYDASVPQIWSYTSDSEMVNINSYFTADSVKRVQMGVLLPDDGVYTISLQEKTSDFEAARVILHDLVNNTLTELSQSTSYSFNGVKGESGQFLLELVNTTGIHPIAGTAIHIYAYQKAFYLKSNGIQSLEGELYIKNTLGQTLQTHRLNGSNEQMVPAHLKSGVYIVTINLADGTKVSQKVVI